MTLRDWVHDVAVVNAMPTVSTTSKELRGRLVCVAFAHNFVEAYRLQDDNDEPVYAVRCSVRCILYAARFHGMTTDDLLLASGTVFNEVLLWQVFGARDDYGYARVLKRFVGHEVCETTARTQSFFSLDLH
jgi:hypothetical protein